MDRVGPPQAREIRWASRGQECSERGQGARSGSLTAWKKRLVTQGASVPMHLAAAEESGSVIIRYIFLG